MLSNLEAGAVLLAVVAPASGMFVAGARHQGRAAVRSPASAHDNGSSVRRQTVARATVVGGVGLLGLVAVLLSSPPALRGIGYPWFHVIPVVVLLALTRVRLVQMRDHPARSDAWWLYAGGALATWAVCGTAILMSSALGTEEAYMLGLMVSPGLPITASMWWGRRPAIRPTSAEGVPGERLPPA